MGQRNNNYFTIVAAEIRPPADLMTAARELIRISRSLCVSELMTATNVEFLQV